MSEMLAQLPMIQTGMHANAEAENQLFQTAELSYLVAEEGQGFFDEVNTDQEAILLNDNETEAEATLLDVETSEAPDDFEQYKTLSNNPQKIITVHTPIKTSSYITLKSHPANEAEMDADAVPIEIPIIQHTALYIQEKTSHAQISLERPDTNTQKNMFVPKDIKQTLNFLSKEIMQDTSQSASEEPEVETSKRDLLSSPKTEIKTADLKVESPPLSAREKVDIALPQITPTPIPKLKKTVSHQKANAIEPSEEQITEQVGGQKKPYLKHDLVSPKQNQIIPQKKITDLANGKIHDSQEAHKTENNVIKIADKSEPIQTTQTAQQKMTLQAINSFQTAPQAANHPTPIQQVAVKLVQSVKSEDTHFKIKIKPHEKIEVEAKLSFDKDGNVKIQIKTDSVETLNDLRKNVHHLERSLMQTGFDKQHQNFEFDLKEQLKDGQHHQTNDQDQSHKQDHQNNRTKAALLDTSIVEESEEYDLQSTGLNIKI